MLELFLGFFILGSLSLAFREGSDVEAAAPTPEPEHLDPFDQSVYDPIPSVDYEYAAKQSEAVADFTNLFHNLGPSDPGIEVDC